MKPVTIDNLKIEDHVRWANDQTLLDPIYTKESPLVAHHPEILWITSLHTSKWDELFDWQKRNIPFAHFQTPDNYHHVSKRLFSYLLFPNIYWNEEEDEEKKDEREQDQVDELKENIRPDLLKQVIAFEKSGAEPSALFEKDKSIIINLLEEIKDLNSLLGQIRAKVAGSKKG